MFRKTLYLIGKFLVLVVDFKITVSVEGTALFYLEISV